MAINTLKFYTIILMKTLLLSIAILCSGFFFLHESNTTASAKPLPDFYVVPPLADSYKAEVVQEVFQKLKAAKGDFRSRKPVLHFVESTGMGIAAAFPLTGVIKLEEKGYDLCTEFGADSLNALAILLAHELIHCYEKHSWENLFAWEYSHTSMKNAVSNEQKKDEIQADYLGGVLAYQAGYKVFGIMDGFLDKVYSAYRLTDENMSNYPGLEQRKLFAVESEDKFRYFTDLFEMANLLTVKGEYDDALAYYDEVLQDFKSREVYNNIGVVSLQSALLHFSPKENKFAYPIELDVVSRMGKGGKGGIDLDYRERKLLDAIFYFENAAHFDPAYPIAHLNKACANALLGVARPATSQLEWKDASVSAERAIQMSDGQPAWRNTLSDGYVMLGILSALNEDNEKAIQLFDKALAIESGHVLATANKSVLGVGENPFSSTGSLKASQETIDGTPFSEMDFGDSNVKFNLRKSPADSIVLWRKDLPNSYVLAHESVKGDPSSAESTFHLFHLTEEGYEGETAKGISLKNGTYELISEKYGKPDKQFRLGNGTLLHYEYKNQELIFRLGPDGDLLGWCIYQQPGG